MKITMDFNEFKRGLEKVNKVTNKAKDVPILDNIYIATDLEGIILTKYNLETQVNYKIYGDVTESGVKLIPASTIKLISNIKKGNEIIITDDEIHIDTKIIKYKNIGIKDYPETKIESNKFEFEITEKELLRMLSCSYATAQDETRPILQGININNNEFAALNGYYISVRSSKEFTSNLNVTMSNDIWKTLIKLLDKKSDKKIKVYITEKENKQTKIRFKFESFDIEGKLFDQEYFKYKQIIPELDDANTIVTVTDNEIHDKLKLFNTLDNGDKCNITKLNIKEDKFTASSSDQENSLTDNINANIQGDELQIAFNNKYLIEVLKQYKDNFNMYMTRNISPMIITVDKENLELLLPVKLVS